MIKTHVAVVNPNTGADTFLGWCYFPEVPIVLPPFDPTKGPADAPSQPQAVPVVYKIGNRMFYILGYRWESPQLCAEDTDNTELPEAFLFLAVQEVQQATKPGLVVAGEGTLAVLEASGMRPPGKVR